LLHLLVHYIFAQTVAQVQRFTSEKVPVGHLNNFFCFFIVLTSLFAVKVAGLVISTEQLISVGWFSFFFLSEYLANNPKIKANSVFQLITGYLKSTRKEDDAINEIKKILRGDGR
jgi:hypothetical protein